MRPEQIHKQPPQTKHAASPQALFEAVLFASKRQMTRYTAPLKFTLVVNFTGALTPPRGYPLGGTPGERFGTFGAGQRYCPRGMSAVRSTTLCDDNKEK